MKKLAVIFLAIIISSGTYAGCLQTVKESIKNTNITLLNERSQILTPGQDSLAYRGEIYNNTKSNVEVFFLSESNGYYKNYSALLLDAKSCVIVARQSLGDDSL